MSETGDRPPVNEVNLFPLEELRNQPPSFWAKDTETIPDKAFKMAKHFARGAKTSYKFDLNRGFLSVFFTSPEHRQLDLEGYTSIDPILHRVREFTSSGDREGAERLVQTKKDVLAKEFKLHFQPSEAAIEVCITELARFFSQDETNSLIHSLKIYAGDWQPDDRDQWGLYAPQIVVYPYADNEKVRKLVGKATQHFRGYEWGNKLTPAYNVKLSDLLYLAQSGSGLKSNLFQLDLLDQFFDKSTNYAFFQGEKQNWQDLLPISPLQLLRRWLTGKKTAQ